MGIHQARKWGVGTLNDFREFFGLKRHDTFESICKSPAVQKALCDLYEHPDKVELYPGVFCESDSAMNGDPGPSDVDSALWAAIFSDAITLVRSDRLDTLDLPPEMVAVLCPRQPSVKASTEEHFEQSPDDSAALAEYFTNLMRGIIRRESAAMDPLGGRQIYSLDVTRDYAIPAVTRYVADFLGLGHMVRSEANPLAKYSENDLYQHITNCQVYRSYNADETRLPKRRLDFFFQTMALWKSQGPHQPNDNTGADCCNTHTDK